MTEGKCSPTTSPGRGKQCKVSKGDNEQFFSSGAAAAAAAAANQLQLAVTGTAILAGTAITTHVLTATAIAVKVCLKLCNITSATA
jgi:hypothetical protein